MPKASPLVNIVKGYQDSRKHFSNLAKGSAFAAPKRDTLEIAKFMDTYSNACIRQISEPLGIVNQPPEFWEAFGELVGIYAARLRDNQRIEKETKP